MVIVICLSINNLFTHMKFNEMPPAHNVPQQPEHEEPKKEKKPSKWLSTTLKSIGAAAAIGGLAFEVSELNESERGRNEDISARLTVSNEMDATKEKAAYDLYTGSLKNYYEVENVDYQGIDGAWVCSKARALEIAIKCGVVDPNITGYDFLWNNIKFNSEKAGTPPILIHFGFTRVPTVESNYTPKELQKLKKGWPLQDLDKGFKSVQHEEQKN